MQIPVTLSKKEKRYHFLYLVGMLLIAVILLAMIFLPRYRSPFSDADLATIQTLEQKAKYEQHQKLSYAVLDSAFSRTNKLPAENISPVDSRDIRDFVNDIATFAENNTVNDPRREGFTQIAQFYKMFYTDKETAANKAKNLKFFQEQYEECNDGYVRKRQEINEYNNSVRNQ